MLDKAIAAVKADKDVALAMFNKGEGGFKVPLWLRPSFIDSSDLA